MPNSFPRSDALPTDDVSFMLEQIAEQADALRQGRVDPVAVAVRLDHAIRLIASLARTLALKEVGDAR